MNIFKGIFVVILNAGYIMAVTLTSIYWLDNPYFRKTCTKEVCKEGAEIDLNLEGEDGEENIKWKEWIREPFRWVGRYLHSKIKWKYLWKS